MVLEVKNTIYSYYKLSKLRVVELLLITTVPAMIVSIYGFPPISLVLYTVIGGTCLAVLNQIFEIETDKLMKRTAQRPLVTGVISIRNAYIFSLGLGSVGFSLLYFLTTPLAASIAIGANIFYSFIYTLVLKPRTDQNIVIGGAAGAAPVLIGWTATGTDLDVGSWLLFLLVFLWTPAHFWALSIENNDDYKDASFPMLSTLETKQRTSIYISIYSCATVLSSLLVAPILQLGLVYLSIALLLGAYLMYKSFQLYKNKIEAISYFIFSNTYLAIVFLAMVADIFFTLRSI